MALGCWAATGAQKTLTVGLGWLAAVLLGTITAVGGGAVRDVVLRQVRVVSARYRARRRRVRERV